MSAGWVQRLSSLAPSLPTQATLRAVAIAHAVHQLGQGLAEVGWWPLLTLQAVGVGLAVWRVRVGLAVVAVAGAASCLELFPTTANHQYLGVIASLFFVLLDASKADERRQLTASLVALPLLALAWGGVTKVLHGAWFDGEALAWLAVGRVDVRLALEPFLSADEFSRVSSVTYAPGAGPLTLSGPLRVFGNVVWLVELLVPAAVVLFPPARARAWWLLVGLSLGIQYVAHEWVFCLLLVNLCLVVAPPRVGRLGRVGVMVAVMLVALAYRQILEVPVRVMPTLAGVRR